MAKPAAASRFVPKNLEHNQTLLEIEIVSSKGGNLEIGLRGFVAKRSVTSVGRVCDRFLLRAAFDIDVRFYVESVERCLEELLPEREEESVCVRGREKESPYQCIEQEASSDCKSLKPFSKKTSTFSSFVYATSSGKHLIGENRFDRR